MTRARGNAEECHDTLNAVTGKSGRGTARQTFRLDAEVWERFGPAAMPATRTDLLKAFILWWLHEGELPERPSAPPAKTVE